MQKYKVKLKREKGWPVYGYFEVENAEKIDEIVASINGYYKKNTEIDKFTILEKENLIDNPERWIKKKKIQSFRDWKRKKSKLMIYAYEMNKILVTITLGFSILLVSLLLLFFKKEVAGAFFSKISLFDWWNLGLILIGVGIILQGLKHVNYESATNLFYFFAFPGILIPLLVITGQDFAKIPVVRWIPVYILLIFLIWFTSVAFIRLVSEGYQLFKSIIKDQKTRMEILLTVFGVIISLIALFK